MKPARHLLKTVGSTLRAAAGRWGQEVGARGGGAARFPARSAPPPPRAPHLSPASAADPAGASRSSPGHPPPPASRGGSSGAGPGRAACGPAGPQTPASISAPRATYVSPECVRDQGRELSEALVDARSAPLLHNRLGGQRVRRRLSPTEPPHAPTTRALPRPAFRCPAALLGLPGARLALADAPASGEAPGFPGVPAGMVAPRLRCPAERAAQRRGGRLRPVSPRSGSPASGPRR